MNRYVAFLRGINVGNIRIKMAELKNCFEHLGMTEVTTFLQTGNVRFETQLSLPEVKRVLEAGLTDTFHYEAYVLLYDLETLDRIARAYPFTREEGHHAYVVFVSDDRVLQELSTLLTNDAEPIQVGAGVLYWKVPKGQSTETPYSKLLAKAKYKATTTTRNLNTLEEILKK